MMPTTASLDDWQRPLAALVASVRHLSGGKPWDVPGIRAALNKARHCAPPHQLAHAAIDWAIMRPDLSAPIGLEDDGPWWRTGRTPAARVVEVRCAVVGHETEPASCCRWCAGMAKGGPSTTEVDGDVLAVSPEQAAINARGRALALARLTREKDTDV